MAKIYLWVVRNAMCRFGLHAPPPVILPGLRWVNCTRCGTPLN